MLSIVTPRSDAKMKSAALVRFHGLAPLLTVSPRRARLLAKQNPHSITTNSSA